MFEKTEGFFTAGVAVCFALLGGLMAHLILRSTGGAWVVIVYLLAGSASWFLMNHIIGLRRQVG